MPAMSLPLQMQKSHLQKNDPPVIFLDNHLSDGMGIDHVARIKKEHPSSCIIMITAHDTIDRSRNELIKKVSIFLSANPLQGISILKTIEKINFA